MSRTVAAVVAGGLARAGAPRLFAAPGAPPSLLVAARETGVAVVSVASRYGACLMAAVTGELAERPGVAWAPLGGGVATLVDGLAHASRDCTPAIVITDDGGDAGLLAPVTRASVVADAVSAGHWIAHAARSAMNEPRGPAHIALADADAPTVPVAASCRPDPPPTPDAAALDALARALAGARRPLVTAGLGCRAADAPWLRAFAEALPAPVLATPKAKGVLPDPHPLALGALSAEHPLAARADFVLALGVAPAEAPPTAWPGLPVAHVARSGDVAFPGVIGDIAAVLEELAPRLRDTERADWDVAELDRMRRAVTAPPAGGFSMRRVVAIAREATPTGVVATFDAPLATVWQATAPHECLVPAGYATAGFALPAAIAASLVGDRPVLAFASAAGLGTVADELPTAAQMARRLVVVTGPVGGDGAGDVTARARDAGFLVFAADGDAGFRTAFARAWEAPRPVLVEVHGIR